MREGKRVVRIDIIDTGEIVPAQRVEYQSSSAAGAPLDEQVIVITDASDSIVLRARDISGWRVARVAA